MLPGSKVYNWLENHGEVFLRRNQSIGKNLMRAKMLHLSHENFVKVLKNTITNVEKLLASADDLVLNGEFEPQDVYTMTKELEQRMTQFLQRVEKRKNILDLSVLFHTHVVELDNWFNELKIQWTGLNLNDINFNSTNLDIVNSCIDNLEKHLEVLGEQKTVTNDAVDKTLAEGDSLLSYLSENNHESKQSSQQHLDSTVQSIKSRHTDIDKLLSSLKKRLEITLQIKQFEKDALETSHNLEHWAEELKYLDEQEHEDKTAESAETWLHSQIQTANQMQVLVFELLQRGNDLVQNLEKIDPENSLNLSAAKQKIQSFIEYLNEREKELHELAIKQQRKLGQCLQINQLETECTQLLNYISNIEMTLFSMLKFARNLEDAEVVKKEHEIFKSNLERVSSSVSVLQSKAQRIFMDNQQNRVVSKFEQLMNNLNSKWQMLLIYIDNRTRLVMAQINFYKYTDQVTTVLESLELEYARDEDWYEKSKNEYDPEQFLQAQIQIHNQKKQSFLKACNWARRTGETFQKYSMRNICDAKMTNSNILHEIEKNTKQIMDDIHLREERTIKSWTNRKNSLDECFQYVIFEKSSKEALAWLAECEASYLGKFQNLGHDRDEMKKLYKEFCEFTERLKNQQGYVNLLIELSPKLLESSIRYGNNIAMWANKVEGRYKEFFNVMSKVQQAYGVQIEAFGCESAKHLAEITNRVILNQEPVIDHKKQQEILKQNEQKQKLVKKRQ
ncbi:Triple functional domain [Brachionus plicatilis]|uniref:Triple functional domain n=1 Tax=Brachionus plicatilis TaxID=10195 RepID=A0A3M7P5P3_BRAPC|nr:Triple functional domain [Brachionus plicatilis]